MICQNDNLIGIEKIKEIKNEDIIEILTTYGDFFYKIFDVKTMSKDELEKIEVQSQNEQLILYTEFEDTDESFYVIFANKI